MRYAIISSKVLSAVIAVSVAPLAAAGQQTTLQRYQAAAGIQSALNRKWVLNSDVAPTWIQGENKFWYRKETKVGSQYIVVDAKTGAKSDAFDHAGLARALAMGAGKPVKADALPLANVQLAPDGTLSFDAFDKRWRYTRSGNLTSSTAQGDRSVSPDGRRAVFEKDYNLWVEDIDTGKITQITTDGEQYYKYGRPVAASYFPPVRPSMEIVWSPDSTRVFTAQTDDRKVLDLPIIDWAPSPGGRPQIHEYRTAVPGDTNVPTFRLVIIDVTNGKMTPVRYAPVPSVRMNDTPMSGNRIWWRADSDEAYFVDVERGEKKVHVLAVNPANGSTKELFSEASDGPVELASEVYRPADIAYLPGRNQLIWYSERSGWPGYYLYDLTSGKMIRSLISGRMVARSLLAIDERRRQAVISVADRVPGKDPYYQEIVRVDLDRPGFRVLSADDSDHVVAKSADLAIGLRTAQSSGRGGVAPSGEYFVETSTRADRPSITVLRDRDGRLVSAVEKADTTDLPKTFRWPEPVRLIAADGVTPIIGLVFKPSDFDPAKTYPVIDVIYGGPQVAAVSRTFGDGFYLDAAALAELGFVTIMMDGRGTALRGREFARHSLGKIETASSLDDHIAGIQQLAAHERYMDLSRVGIYGFSAGGYMAARAMLQYPDFFKVGVSGDGNHDQRLFWNTWGERYEGYPLGNNYLQQANITDVSRLKGKLLLMHALTDYAVSPANTLQLAQALIEANKDFDLLVWPKVPIAGHSMPDYGFRKTWDYFTVNLKGETPPPEFLLITGGVRVGGTAEPVDLKKKPEAGKSPSSAAATTP